MCKYILEHSLPLLETCGIENREDFSFLIRRTKISFYLRVIKVEEKKDIRSKA